MENMSNNKNNTRVHYLAAMTVPHVDGDISRTKYLILVGEKRFPFRYSKLNSFSQTDKKEKIVIKNHL